MKYNNPCSLVGLALILLISICGGEEIRQNSFAQANLFSGATFEGDTSIECYYEACPPGWAKQGWSNCYLIRPIPATRNNAELDCLALNATLAIPRSDTDRAYLNQLAMKHFPINNGLWVGTIRRGDYWFTSDLVQFNYNAWIPGQPEFTLGQCAYLYSNDVGLTTTYWGRLSVESCSLQKHYACQRSQYDYDKFICQPH